MAQPEDPEDSTFWPALPCQECDASDVPFCLDGGGQVFGACEQHIVMFLKQMLFDTRADCLVIRNEPVMPLTWEGKGVGHGVLSSN